MTMILRKRKLWHQLKNSSQETIDFPIKFVMKNLNKVPNHINIQDEKIGFNTTHKKKKKSRKKSNSSKKNIASAGCSKLLSQPSKSRQSKQRNPNGSNNTPLKRKTVKFNCDVPCRFLKNKSKQTIPQTTRNSQRKILLDYGNSNFLLEKEIKLKSRRNSKKHGSNNCNNQAQRSQSKGNKKPINFTKTLIYTKKNSIQKGKRSPCRSERKIVKNKDIRLNERFPFILPDELSPENIIVDINGLHTDLNKTQQKRAPGQNDENNGKSEFRRVVRDRVCIEEEAFSQRHKKRAKSLGLLKDVAYCNLIK